MTGIPDARPTSPIPLDTTSDRYSKCGVSPCSKAPRQMTASYFFESANFLAARTISRSRAPADGRDVVRGRAVTLQSVESAVQQAVADKRIEPADDDGKSTSGCIQLSLNSFGHITSTVKANYSAGDTPEKQLLMTEA